MVSECLEFWDMCQMTYIITLFWCKTVFPTTLPLLNTRQGQQNKNGSCYPKCYLTLMTLTTDVVKQIFIIMCNSFFSRPYLFIHISYLDQSICPDEWCVCHQKQQWYMTLVFILAKQGVHLSTHCVKTPYLPITLLIFIYSYSICHTRMLVWCTINAFVNSRAVLVSWVCLFKWKAGFHLWWIYEGSWQVLVGNQRSSETKH